MNLRKEWASLGDDKQIKTVSGTNSDSISQSTLIGPIGLDGLPLEDKNITSWFGTQDPSDLNLVQSNSLNISSSVGTSDPTTIDFERKMGHMAQLQRDREAEHQEQVTYADDAAAQAASQQMHTMHTSGGLQPPGCTTAYTSTCLSQYLEPLYNTADESKICGDDQDCRAAWSRGWDTTTKSGAKGFWNWCLKRGSCLEKMANAANEHHVPGTYPPPCKGSNCSSQQLCKIVGGCTYPTHSNVKQPSRQPKVKQNQKKPIKKPTKKPTAADTKSKKSTKGAPTKNLRGRADMKRKDILNPELAANLDGLGDFGDNLYGVGYWNLPIMARTSGYSYYSPPSGPDAGSGVSFASSGTTSTATQSSAPQSVSNTGGGDGSAAEPGNDGSGGISGDDGGGAGDDSGADDGGASGNSGTGPPPIMPPPTGRKHKRKHDNPFAGLFKGLRHF